jgi:hypothetical protein
MTTPPNKETKCSPTPWRLSGLAYELSGGVKQEARIEGPKHEQIAAMLGENGFANAARIVACVNACKEFRTDELEITIGPLVANLSRHKRNHEQQLSDLRAALQKAKRSLFRLEAWCSQDPTGPIEASGIADFVRKTIADGLGKDSSRMPPGKKPELIADLDHLRIMDKRQAELIAQLRAAKEQAERERDELSLIRDEWCSKAMLRAQERDEARATNERLNRRVQAMESTHPERKAPLHADAAAKEIERLNAELRAANEGARMAVAINSIRLKKLLRTEAQRDEFKALCVARDAEVVRLSEENIQLIAARNEFRAEILGRREKGQQ